MLPASAAKMLVLARAELGVPCVHPLEHLQLAARRRAIVRRTRQLAAIDDVQPADALHAAVLGRLAQQHFHSFAHGGIVVKRVVQDVYVSTPGRLAAHFFVPRALALAQPLEHREVAVRSRGLGQVPLEHQVGEDVDVLQHVQVPGRRRRLGQRAPRVLGCAVVDRPADQRLGGDDVAVPRRRRPRVRVAQLAAREPQRKRQVDKRVQDRQCVAVEPQEGRAFHLASAGPGHSWVAKVSRPLCNFPRALCQTRAVPELTSDARAP